MKILTRISQNKIVRRVAGIGCLLLSAVGVRDVNSAFQIWQYWYLYGGSFYLGSHRITMDQFGALITLETLFTIGLFLFGAKLLFE